jgi:hypothetical protein
MMRRRRSAEKKEKWNRMRRDYSNEKKNENENRV